MSQKQVLVWDHDDRSIGVMDDEDRYVPVILYNFSVVGNINEQHHPYRGWVCLVKTTDGKDFKVILSVDEVKSFKTFHRCVTDQTWGADLSYIPFDEALWTELFVRIKYECKPLPHKKPATNWGLQVNHLKACASKRGGKWLVEDIEDVYPGVVFDGNGKPKEDPIHVVVPKLIGFQLDVPEFDPSGLQGLLEMFLPPYTSEDPQMRKQQVAALVCVLCMHFYRLIIYNIGGCPGLVLGSYEPETLKSSTALIGLKMAGDPSHFLECSSSKESVEVRQTSTTLTTFLDDGNRPQVLEDILVGSYQGASKSTITRGASEKLGGFAATKNFKQKETINPKVIEGRAILLVMEKIRQVEKGVSSVRDHYSKKVKHTNAMASTSLPRDFCAFFKRHFVYETEEDLETEYQNMHLAACELLAECKPEYDPRRLEALAHPLAFVMLLQKDVEEEGCENTTRLFIDAFKDRKSFLEGYLVELDKADNVIEELSREYRTKNSTIDDTEDDGMEEERDENLDEKIEKLLDRFAECDQLERTRFVKAFDEKDKTTVLAVAHTKLEQYDKTWSKLKFPKNLPTGFTKPFTRPNATSNSKMLGATCKIFPLKSMNPSLQKRIRDTFPGLKPVVDEPEVDDLDIPASQDFPAILQRSPESGTLQSCKICNFQSRREEDMSSHMVLHPKCTPCGKTFTSDKTLKIHMDKVHETFSCDVCFEDIPTSQKTQHKNQHKTETQFGRGLQKGKVTKNKKVDEHKKTTEKKKKSGYLTFCATMRPVLKEKHKPTPKEMMALLGSEWRKLSKKEQDEWNKRALESQDEEDQVQPAAVQKETVPALVEAVQGPSGLQQASKGVRKPVQRQHEGELNRIEAPENNHRISHCGVCGILVNRKDYERHMEVYHVEEPDVIQETETIDEPDIIQETETTDEPEVLENQDVIEAVEQEAEVVMVKRKTLWWPAQVVEKNNEDYLVKILNKTETVTKINKNHVKKFTIDNSQIEGMKREWRDAYLKAVKIVSGA